MTNTQPLPESPSIQPLQPKLSSSPLNDKEVKKGITRAVDEVAQQTLPTETKTDAFTKLPSLTLQEREKNEHLVEEGEIFSTEGKTDQLEEAVTKTEQVSKGWWETITGGIISNVQHYATEAIQKFAGNYGSQIDKERLIAESKQVMMENLHDPQFVEMYDMMRVLLGREVESKMSEVKGGFFAQNILPQQGLIQDLIEINLARGFANLARQVNENREQIPNYDQQPSLASILSLFCQKTGAHIDAKRLASLEEKYRNPRAQLPLLTKKMFPAIDSEPKKQELIKEYLKATIDIGRKNEIEAELFPDFDDIQGERAKDIQEFLQTCHSLRERQKELQELFNQVADDVLIYLFPNKFSDLEIPGFLQYGIVQNYIYDHYIRAPLADFLRESYEPLERDATRLKGWENDLQVRVGAPDLQPFIQAPAAFLTALTANYIQADPRAVGVIAWAIDNKLHPQTSTSTLSESQQHNRLMEQLSQKQLANWIVESIQTILNTEDPHLLGLGQFAKQGVNHLTLALLANGAKVVFPEGGEIDENQFIKEFSDRIIAKFESLKIGEAISDEFWKNFVQDLPLPPIVKDLLVPFLIENAKSLQAELKKPALQEIQRMFSESEKTILSYENGEELLTITEKFSDQIIEQALEENIELVTTLGVGDTLEELFMQYLPGVKINDDLKKWVKENISALGVTEGGESPQSILLLKQGIQAVLRKALVNTIEMNFKNNSKDYAAQLLKNIHQAFAKAITGFNESQREDLDKALAIQERIETQEARIQDLKEKISNKPNGLTPEQMTLLEDHKNANIRHIRASNYVKNLLNKRDEIFTSLNENFEDEFWAADKLPFFNKALALYKMRSTASLSREAYIAQLQKEIEEIEELDEREILLALLEMSTEEIELVSEVLNIEATLQHAQQELKRAEEDLVAKGQAVNQHDLEKLNNRSDWDKAKEWLNETLKSRQEIDHLSHEIKEMETELDSHLKVFQILSHEITALIGLEDRAALNLPAFLDETIWTLIESAKNQHISRLLFKQITPILLPALDIQKNKDTLSQLSKGNQFFAKIAHEAAEEIVSRIPDFITSYKPSAQQIVMIMGDVDPTEQEISRMEIALQQKMIELGKEGTVASMLQPLLKDLVPMDKEQAISQALEQLIAQGKDKEFSRDQILQILKREISTTNKKEEQQLEKQAQKLAKIVNEFLLNRGKTKLKREDLLEAYQGQVAGTQKPVQLDQIKEVLASPQVESIVQKIKTVIITPEEIAIAISDIIPGATELHTLIAPQLQDVIVGDDKTFKENREHLQRYVEGVILRLFVKIAQANAEQDQDILVVLTRKLKDLTIDEKVVADKSAEEVTRQIVDQLLEEVVGIASKDDLEGLPAGMRNVAYEKLKEVAYQHLTPLLLPMIERTQNRVELERLTGSKFLGNLSEALAKDVFYLLPAGVKSYRSIAAKLFVLLSDGKQPSDQEIEQFAQSIQSLMEKLKDKNVTHKSLVQAYAKVVNIKITSDQLANQKAKLDRCHAKEEIQNVLMTPEEITDLITADVSNLDPELQKAFANAIQGLIHNSPDIYGHVSDFAGSYVEGMLLRVFLKIAEKNPPQKDKDTLVVITEKLLEMAATKFRDNKKSSVEEMSKELINSMMHDILGLDSPEVFEGLPGPLKTAAFEGIKDQLGGMVVRILQSLKAGESSNVQVQQAQENAKQFGIADLASEGYVEILSHDLANLVMAAVPDVLTEIGGTKMRGVNLVSKEVEIYLEELARGNLEVAKVLLKYTKGAQFQKLLGDNLAKIGVQKGLEDKKKAADLIGNLILVPLNQALGRIIDFEEQQGAEFNQKLMANILNLAADHLKNLNVAKENAARENRPLLHQDFVKAAGDKLHAGVPKTPLTYQNTIDMINSKIVGSMNPEQKAKWLQEEGNLRQAIVHLIKEDKQGLRVVSVKDIINEIDKIHTKVTGIRLTKEQRLALKAVDDKGLTLRDHIRQESLAHSLQREEAFYGPAAKTVLKMLFPNGKKDLTFVSEELRDQTWKMFKKSLFPTLLPMLTELVLDPDVLNQIVLSSLETMRDTLNEEIVLEPEEAEDRPFDELDRASGKLMAEMLKTVKLPDWIKKNLIDPKTGKVSPAMEKTLGATLRKQFNGTFLKDKLHIALEKMVQRDESGDYMLKYDTSPKAEKVEKTEAKREKVKEDLKSVSREVVDASISYFIRSRWTQAQARFDQLIEKIFGKIGLKLKGVLDAVFGFVFFKVVGTILSVLFAPIKGWVKEKIYKLISLDQNREALLALLGPGPVDQPETEGYAVYHEDLVFKIGKALKETVEEALKEPIEPEASV
jgi:hypothetical protein